MKRKLFAAAAAAMLAVCALAAPLSVSAETETPKYLPGDVNMDGVVNGSDSLLVMQNYVLRVCLRYDNETMKEEGSPFYFTEEQAALADVSTCMPENPSSSSNRCYLYGHYINLCDSVTILRMHVARLTFDRYFSPEEIEELFGVV